MILCKTFTITFEENFEMPSELDRALREVKSLLEEVADVYREDGFSVSIAEGPSCPKVTE